MIIAACPISAGRAICQDISQRGQAIAPVWALVEVLNEVIARNMSGKYAAAQRGFCGLWGWDGAVRQAGSQLSGLWGAT